MTTHRPRTALRVLSLVLLLWGHGLAAQALRTALPTPESPFETLENPSIPHQCADVMRAVEALDPELRFTGLERALPLNQIESELSRGALDVFCAMLRSPSRESRWVFIDVPIRLDRQRLAVNAKDTLNPSSLEQLRQSGEAVAVIKGSAHEEWLGLQGGIQLESKHALSGSLDFSQMRRARFAFQSEEALLQTIQTQCPRQKWRLLPWVVREEGLYFVASLHLAPGRAGRLRAALAERGELARIAQRPHVVVQTPLPLEGGRRKPPCWQR